MLSMSQSQHMGSVRSIYYTACGGLIVSCAEDKTGIHNYSITSWSPTIIIANYCSWLLVKLWCLSSLQNMYTFKASDCPVAVCAHPSERHILAYATSGTVLINNNVWKSTRSKIQFFIIIIDKITGIDLRNPKLNLFELSKLDEPFTYMEFISNKELIIR